MLLLCPEGGGAHDEKMKFRCRLFKRQFHPLCGVNIIHMADNEGNYEMSYLTILKTPFSANQILSVGFDKDMVKTKMAPQWLRLMLEGEEAK